MNQALKFIWNTEVRAQAVFVAWYNFCTTIAHARTHIVEISQIIVTFIISLNRLA